MLVYRSNDEYVAYKFDRKDPFFASMPDVDEFDHSNMFNQGECVNCGFNVAEHGFLSSDTEVICPGDYLVAKIDNCVLNDYGINDLDFSVYTEQSFKNEFTKLYDKRIAVDVPTHGDNFEIYLPYALKMILSMADETIQVKLEKFKTYTIPFNRILFSNELIAKYADVPKPHHFKYFEDDSSVPCMLIWIERKTCHELGILEEDSASYLFGVDPLRFQDSYAVTTIPFKKLVK